MTLIYCVVSESTSKGLKFSFSLAVICERVEIIINYIPLVLTLFWCSKEKGTIVRVKGK
jgi:hypothetical protein